MRFLVHVPQWNVLQKELVELSGNQIIIQVGEMQYADFSDSTPKQ